MKMYRQGDILFIEIEHIMGSKIDTDVIQEGESTGHAHRIKNGQIFSLTENNLYLEAFQNAVVFHEEHAPLQLPQGNYKVIRQREFAPKRSVSRVRYARD